jgi:GNAT superfamily N-acetyltransferase
MAGARARATTAPAITIRLRRRAPPEGLKMVWRGLSSFNRSVVGDLPYAHFLIEARSPRGRLLGGLEGMVYYQWLFVVNFFLTEAIRRGGIGRRMIAEAEKHAASLGCHGVWLDTFGWQARPFYEKQGYRVFGRLPDYPDGYARWFMMKRLKPAAGAKGPRPRPATRTKSRRA